MNGTLSRHSHGKFGTFSDLQIGGLELVMVEQDWENNKPYVSCIPNGTYILEYYVSEKHGPSYILSNIELNIGKFKGEATRFGCLIHKANLASQLQGQGARALRPNADGRHDRRHTRSAQGHGAGRRLGHHPGVR